MKIPWKELPVGYYRWCVKKRRYLWEDHKGKPDCTHNKRATKNNKLYRWFFQPRFCRLQWIRNKLGVWFFFFGFGGFFVFLWLFVFLGLHPRHMEVPELGVRNKFWNVTTRVIIYNQELGTKCSSMYLDFLPFEDISSNMFPSEFNAADMLHLFKNNSFIFLRLLMK